MRGEGLEIFCKKISGEDAYKGPETMLLRKYKNSALMDSYLSHVYGTEGMNHCLKEFFTEDNH